jgi:alpha-aminoadipate carrier protein LysW
MATCPECEADVEVDEYDVDKGDLISCPECGSHLEVTSVTPVELDVAPEEAEDELDEDEEGDDLEEEEEEEEDWDE